MQEIITKLSEHDLERLRRSQANVNALDNVPNIDVDEAAEIHYQHMILTAELIELYEVDDAENWRISTYTGSVSYND